MSETCQKLAFTHPIVVLKSGLKNNWMRKLDRVNRRKTKAKQKVQSCTKMTLSVIKIFFISIVFYFRTEDAQKIKHTVTTQYNPE